MYCYITLGKINLLRLSERRCANKPCMSDDEATAVWNSESSFLWTLSKWPWSLSIWLHRILGVMQYHVYQTPVWDVADLMQRLFDTYWMAYCKALSMMLLVIGIRDFMLVWMKREAILNTCCDICAQVQTSCVDKLDMFAQR